MNGDGIELCDELWNDSISISMLISVQFYPEWMSVSVALEYINSWSHHLHQRLEVCRWARIKRNRVHLSIHFYFTKHLLIEHSETWLHFNTFHPIFPETAYPLNIPCGPFDRIGIDELLNETNSFSNKNHGKRRKSSTHFIDFRVTSASKHRWNQPV